MREKVVPIPFLGKEVSAWLYRTTRWVQEHPYRACGIVLAAAAGTVLYEANVTHKDRIPSPNVNNHLEYELRREWRLWPRSTAPADGDDTAVSRQVAIPLVNSSSANNNEKNSNVADTNISKRRSDSPSQEVQAQASQSAARLQEAERLLSLTEDPEKLAELRRIIEQETEATKGYDGTTMKVTSGHLYVREPHWNIRNNERNWSILSRDQQQQKDHYWYRLERSREDDFARNTYSK